MLSLMEGEEGKERASNKPEEIYTTEAQQLCGDMRWHRLLQLPPVPPAMHQGGDSHNDVTFTELGQLTSK